MNRFWDEKYGTDEYVYGRTANLFFHDQLALIPPGQLLLPGEGEGRNAVYAALNGWEVTALDQSEIARAKAYRLAEENGIEFRYEIGDITEMDFPEASFDAVAMLFVHVPQEVRSRFHLKLVEILRPGGWIIGEYFHLSQAGFTSGGPRPEMLYSAEMLAKDFEDLRLDILEEKNVYLNEGKAHSGEAAVIRLLGQKSL